MSGEDEDGSCSPDSVASVESLDLVPEGAEADQPSSSNGMTPLAGFMDLRSADYRRRDRDRRMVQEEQEKIQRNREIRMREKEEEQKRDKEMLMSYNPWGRPGAGAPSIGNHHKNQVVSKEYTGLSPDEASQGQGDLNDELLGGFLRGLGRPGAGAPLRTGSGRLQVQISGDPELRFGAKVAQSIENGLRYKGPGKEDYRKELDIMVQQKQETKEKERLLQRQEEEDQTKLYPFGRHSGEERNENEPFFPPLDEAVETYHPWGRGQGNPRRDERGRVHGQRLRPTPLYAFQEDDYQQQNGSVLLPPFGGRGGGGAPQRSSTGTLNTRLRHFTGSSEPGGGRLPNLNEDDGVTGFHPWGRPGHGAPFTRETGRNFLQRMGWSTTNEAESQLSTSEGKQTYLNDLRRDMESRREKQKLEKEKLFSSNDTDFVDVMLEKTVGKPKRDPDTGRLLTQAKGHSDVTAQRMGIRRLEDQDRRQYHSALRRQTEERQARIETQKNQEKEQLKQHLETFEGLWGKPGNGAPREGNKRVNLQTILFSNADKQDQQNGFARYAKGKDYEFHAPWAAMIY